MATTTSFFQKGQPSQPPQSQLPSSPSHPIQHHAQQEEKGNTERSSTISNILKVFQAASSVPSSLVHAAGGSTRTSSTDAPPPPLKAGFSERGFQKFTNTRYAVVIAFCAFLLYLILGIVVFAVWMEDWDAIDAAYFTVTTFTTVGYGDLFPVTRGQRIFAMFFVTIGIMIIGGVVLGVVMNVLFSAFEKSLLTSSNRAQNTFLKKFRAITRRRRGGGKKTSGVVGVGSHNPHQEESGEEDHDDDEEEHHHHSRRRGRHSFQKRILSLGHNLGLALLVFLPGIVIGHFEQWALHESIYYSIITATTVGYGDLSPKKRWTRFAACFYLPLCVTIMASIFSKITSVYLDKKSKEAEKEFFQRRLTHQDIEKMDLGGDGTVNPEEFLIFMLVNMGKVDEESIRQIQSLFHDLDKDGNGCLDARDLLLMTYAADEEGADGKTNCSDIDMP